MSGVERTTLSGRLPASLDDEGPGPADPVTGLRSDYWVLSHRERARGFLRPVRTSYRHGVCGEVTLVSTAIAETFARDPGFYSNTYCAICRNHPPVAEFNWCEDGDVVGA